MKKAIWLGVLSSVLGSLVFGGRLDERFNENQINLAKRQAWEPSGATGYLLEIELADQDTDGDGLSDAYEIGQGRYQVVEGSFTWFEAKADAESRDAHLATITTEAEWNAIQSFVGEEMKNAMVWLGASDDEVEGVWKWVTGERWEYARWASPSEPSGVGGAGPESFLMTWGANNWFWNDGFWGDRRGYVLERGYPTNPNMADSDGDGFLDGDELRSDSNPLDPASQPVPALSIFPAVEIEFQSENGKGYQVQSSTNLTSWSDFGGVFTGTGGKISQFFQSREKGPKFYRLQRLP